MPTHAELGAKLLVDAADFFDNLGSQNPPLKAQMDENAAVFRQMSALLNQDPQGMLDDSSHAELASRLLHDTATFFRTLADKNPPLKEQMDENANVYEQIGTLLEQDPQGILE